MIRHRITTALVSFAMAASLLASAAAAPATTLASEPSWDDMVVVSLPTAVHPGDVAGYQISIHNRGPGNIAQLYLFAATNLDRPAYQDPLPGCNTTGRFYCALGQLKAGATVYVTVAYTTPPSGTSFSVDFEANTTGATTSDGGTSHGDVNPGTGTTSLIASNDFAGRFVNSFFQQTVEDSQAIVSGNAQATKVVVNNQFIPVTVQDGDGFNPTDLFTCTLSTKTFSCADLDFGEWSAVNVDNGTTFFEQLHDHDHDRCRRGQGPGRHQEQSCRLPPVRWVAGGVDLGRLLGRRCPLPNGDDRQALLGHRDQH